MTGVNPFSTAALSPQAEYAVLYRMAQDIESIQREDKRPYADLIASTRSDFPYSPDTRLYLGYLTSD